MVVTNNAHTLVLVYATNSFHPPLRTSLVSGEAPSGGGGADELYLFVEFDLGVDWP